MHFPCFRHLALCLGLGLSLGAILKGQPINTPYHFTVLATDTITGGSIDGAAADARFASPSAVAVDAHGNLIIADPSNHAIRQIAPDGRVTTVAGLPGHAGYKDGQGTAARFNQPTGVAIDRVGNIIVADNHNRMIRRITPQGVVTTIAGNASIPQAFPTDGIATVASFTGPTALVTDLAGNIYVADSLSPGPFGSQATYYYTSIRKITPDGIVSTIAGHIGAAQPASAQPLAAPTDLSLSYVNCLALDADGNLYFADGNSLSDGVVVRKITPSGVVTTLVANSSASGSPGVIAGLAVDARGQVFLADRGDHVLRKIAPDGTLTTVAGTSGSQGNVDGNASSARFSSPGGLAVDAHGNLFVADTGNNTIRKVASDGTVSTLAGHPAGTTGLEQLLANGTGLAIDRQGALYAQTTTTVLRVTTDGTFTTLAGTAGQTGSTDGTGPDARFTNIRNLAVDSNGNVYVTDGHAIRKITSRGAVTTLAGDVTLSGANDATGSAARFNAPSALAADTAGNVYVADAGNDIIRQVTPGGVVTTLAGLANVAGQSDGLGSSARFSGQFVSITHDDTTGNIFVIDSSKVRKITPDETVTTLQSTANSGVMTIDPSGNLFTIHGNLSVGPDQRRIFPYTIAEVAPDGTANDLGGGFDGYGPVSGTGYFALLSPSIAFMAIAPDGRIFVRGGSSLSVGAPNGAPMAGTASTTTASNQAVNFTLPASDPDGDALTYTITGTVSGTATVSGNLAAFTPTSGATGTGSVSFTATDGYATSGTGTVSVAITPAVTMLVNISTRGQVGAGDNALIAGFVLTGPANTPKTVLVRAAGPTLATQGVGRPLSRPVITLVQGSTVLGSNQGWSTAGNAADIATVGTAVNAFPFPAGSNDSALLTQLLPGVYSAVVSGVGGDGIALAEVYDGEAANPAHHPVNVSTRGLVGTGDDVLIAGLIVSGTSPQKFLIRAVGPGLSVFNIAGRLADPQFHLYQGPTVTMHVTGLTNDSAMQAAVTQTGAFPLPDGSDDAAAIVTLAPGNYTVIASSRSGASGIALVEVYQMP